MIQSNCPNVIEEHFNKLHFNNLQRDKWLAGEEKPKLCV